MPLHETNYVTEEIKRGEIELANDLFKRHQAMVASGKWDGELHNQTMIQLQVAWPYVYALLSNNGNPEGT